MKKFLSLVIATTLSLSLVACSSSQNTNESSSQTTISSENTTDENNKVNNNSALSKIKEKGELIMATSPDYPPYEFKIMENGKEKMRPD